MSQRCVQAVSLVELEVLVADDGRLMNRISLSFSNHFLHLIRHENPCLEIALLSIGQSSQSSFDAGVRMRTLPSKGGCFRLCVTAVIVQRKSSSGASFEALLHVNCIGGTILHYFSPTI